ncbi:MAG: hypothetical protein AB1558_08025 [Thermodesulfobacteriota bacterium]
MSRVLEVIMKAQDTRKTLRCRGSEPDRMGPPRFVKSIEAEALERGKVVREANIKGE